jgi:aryl-alcohol dehydrogenase-like predicted oxidoreductase
MHGDVRRLRLAIRKDRAESIATVQAALDAGINLLDTDDLYGSGHNEMLVGEALRGRRPDQAILSVKFGVLRDPDGGLNGFDNRPPQFHPHQSGRVFQWTRWNHSQYAAVN